MIEKNSSQERIYHIRLKGYLDPSMTAWFGDIKNNPQENDETLLIGEFADQAALRGFLEHLWNFNFIILSIERV